MSLTSKERQQKHSARPAAADSSLVEVRAIANPRELETVYRLTHDCYVSKGYAVSRPNDLFIHYPHFDYLKETTVWVALVNEKIVGSISVTRDSRYGFPQDEEFKDECEHIRAEGRKSGAAWRLVVSPSYREGGRVLMSLIETSIANFLSQGGDTFLLTVNPEHERVYTRLLNMKTIAQNPGSVGLQKAPAVLMCGMVETMPQRWKSRFAEAIRLGAKASRLKRAA